MEIDTRSNEEGEEQETEVIECPVDKVPNKNDSKDSLRSNAWNYYDREGEKVICKLCPTKELRSVSISCSSQT